MPSRTLSYFGYASVALIAAYLFLMVATVWLAAWQTSLSVAVHETEQDIARLERQYYARVAEIDQTHPSALGLAAPKAVTYASLERAPAVSLR
jgi:hypothetical protein